MKELFSGLPPGAKDTGPDDIFAQVAGKDKGGRVKMYGKGVTASVIYGDMPRQVNIPTHIWAIRMKLKY